MKKVNKILMAVIAILLSLVLISTSVVSGIFARYVIQKKVEAPIVFDKFGVKLQMTVDSDLESKTTVTRGQLGDTMIVNMSGLTLSPGDDFSDALKFQLSGAPNFDVDLKIQVNIYLGRGAASGTAFENTWGVANSKIESLGISEGITFYLPVGFTFAVDPTDTTVDKYALKPWFYTDDKNQFNGSGTDGITVNDAIELKVAEGIANKISNANKSLTAGTVTVGFSKGNTTPALTIGETSTTQFYMGFEYPMTYSLPDTNYTSDVLDAISVALSKNENARYQTIDVTYRVAIEQR